MELITIDRLSIGYDGNVIVGDISFNINKGDYISIIGDNGAGKSTLLRTILSLHKPLLGSIIFNNVLRQADIGYLPQARDIQKDFPANVYEIVISGCLNKSGLRPFYVKAEHSLAQECLKKLGILNLAKRCYRELSGGQQQRVLLARALCASNKIIFLDEPVSGLDPDATMDMYETILKLNRNDGTTIIMVSHDILASKKYSSHILRLENGRAIMMQKGVEYDNI